MRAIASATSNYRGQLNHSQSKSFALFATLAVKSFDFIIVDSVNYNYRRYLAMNQASLDRSLIQSVRQFNRFYTRRIGLLQESWLQSPYTLTEVRVLYELSARKRATATELWRDLGLDAGYLSRMMRKFEDQALVARVRSPKDKRQSFVSLTAKGRKRFAPLERRQIEEVGAMLKSVAAPDRHRLLEAMGVIQHALNGATAAAKYRLRSHRTGDMGWVVHRHGVLYSREWGYDERFEALVAGIVSEFVENFDPDREQCWIAERNGETLGSIDRKSVV